MLLYCFLLTEGNQLLIQEDGRQRFGGEVASNGASLRELCPPSRHSGEVILRGNIPREHIIHRCDGQHLRDDNLHGVVTQWHQCGGQHLRDGSLRGVGKQ